MRAIAAVARASASTNTTCDAPRLRASNPSAPVPANTSSTRAPSILGASTLNRVSRSRSDVGRSPSHDGDGDPPSLQPPGDDPHYPTWMRPNCSSQRSRTNVMQGRRETALDQQARFAVGLLHDVAVAHQIAGAELRQTRLPRAEEVAGTAQLEVAFGDDEAVVGLGHRAQPFARVVAPRRLVQQDAVRLPLATADAAAQLVELRQAEALGVLHDHHRGVGHIHADLDDRGGHQHVRRPRHERLHHLILRVLFHPAVQQRDAAPGKHLGLEVVGHLGGRYVAPSGAGGGEAPRRGGGKTPNLDQFTVNLTEKAKKGKLDPVLGRDFEIRQIVDILTRRRQNNPILTGEAGVGKTAVVEGFALRIVQGDVPDALKNVTLRTLDLALLQAGAGVKGEFENRLKGLIEEVKNSRRRRSSCSSTKRTP